jgi:hypothetical protein
VSDHLSDLAARRANLQRRAELQRARLGMHVRAIESSVSGADGLLSARFLLQKPVLIAGGAALLFFIGPRRAFALAGRAMFLFSTARRLVRLLGRRGDAHA